MRFSIRYKITAHGVAPDKLKDDEAPTAEFLFFGDVGEELVDRPAMILADWLIARLCASRDKNSFWLEITLTVELSKGSFQRFHFREVIYLFKCVHCVLMLVYLGISLLAVASHLLILPIHFKRIQSNHHTFYQHLIQPQTSRISFSPYRLLAN